MNGGNLVYPMDKAMLNAGLKQRIVGVETEFGCLVEDEYLGSPDEVVNLIKDTVFFDLKLGAIDLHARDDVFEPAQSGGFLLNGSRFYIDAVGSHLEYATAECLDLKDLVANDRAGQRQIVRAIKELGFAEEVNVYNNSIDHFGGHTFGCHENYLITDADRFLNERLPYLYPFLSTRQIFAGVGRVGGHILTGDFRPNYQEISENPIDYIWVSHVYGVITDASVPFQLSQRADHILKTIASRVRFNRAMINPKWEHFYTHDGTTRLHLLFGESNQNEFAYALKVGTTSLVLRLIEEDLVPPDLLLDHPVLALREVSRDQSLQWIVKLANGSTIKSVDLQRIYLEQAQKLKGESNQTDWILSTWESTLDGLERDPMSMGDRIDWVAKRLMIEEYRTMNGLDWGDDALHSVDLEYHNIDPDKGLFYGLQEMGKTKRMITDADIAIAQSDPPTNTRAFGRSKLVEKVLQRKKPRYYVFDWNGVALDRYNYIEMEDPFNPYEDVADQTEG